MADLKPCPFCGNSGDGIAVITEQEMAEMSDGQGSNEGFYIICQATNNGCGSNSGWGISIDSASAIWNTRITQDKVVEVKESVLVNLLVRVNNLEKQRINNGNN